MATRKSNAKKPAKPPLAIHAFSVTTDNDTLLSEIAGAASDRIGRKVSSSAVLRALLGFMGEQSADWTAREIFPRIEKEIGGGRTWGTRSKASSSTYKHKTIMDAQTV